MKENLEKILQAIIKDFGVENINPKVELTTDLNHGDFTTNVAFLLSKPLKSKPIEIAKKIANELKVRILQYEADAQHHLTNQSSQKISENDKNISILQDIKLIDVAPPGFINFTLSASKLSTSTSSVLNMDEGVGTKQQSAISNQPTDKTENKKSESCNLKAESSKIMVEFAHPNTHKAFHIGHLRNITTGETIVRLLESQGIKVIRANYQGDVGMHIAKAIFGLLQIQNLKSKMQNLRNINERMEFLGKAYIAGSKAYEDLSANGDKVKETIKDINYLIYAAAQKFQKEQGKTAGSIDFMKFVYGRGVEVNEIYTLWKMTRQWSLDYFDEIYKRVGTHYDRLYFESEVFEPGKANVLKGLERGIFVKSDGAIIFPGEKQGLHNRVFINNLGLPTYEGKDMGLAPLQYKEYDPDLVIHVLGPEQVEYFKVVIKALEQLFPETKGKQYHLVYGWVKLKHGKMSSRLGNVILGEWLLDEAKKAVYNIIDSNISKDDINTSNNNVILSEVKGSSQILNKDSRLHGNDKGDGKDKGIKNDKVTRYSKEEKDEIAEKTAIAAVKYSFLKVSTTQDIAFDLDESINFEGDSGPYLLYTYARCRSVIRKANQTSDIRHHTSDRDVIAIRQLAEKQSSSKAIEDQKALRGRHDTEYNPEELTIMRQLYRFEEIVAEAAKNYAPNILCKYLYDLACYYNLFYNKHSILGSANTKTVTNTRLMLTQAVAVSLKRGLYLLGIQTLEKM